MSDLFNAIPVNPADDNKIKRHLEKIREAQATDGDLVDAINAASNEFNKFFLNYGGPSFSENKLLRNDTPRSEAYNENLETLEADIQDLYDSMDSASQNTLSSYNFASLAASEIKNQAQIAASKVLDLNIINNFIKGQAIVAGDDFIDDSKIDMNVGVDTVQAIILDGASAITLVPVDAEVITGPQTKIDVTPLLPTTDGGSVNREPTPSNLERFYEGQYHAPIGDQRPEGGELKLKYIVDPQDVPEGTATTTTSNGQLIETTNGGADQFAATTNGGVGYYAVVQPTEEDLRAERIRMVDGNPSTFWQCEYVFKVPSLIDPFLDQNND